MKRKLELLGTCRCIHTVRKIQEIGIIGGGIAGLSAAYFLQKSLPHARITLIEQAPRLGGWLSSKKNFTDGQKHYIFEEGPRSLRPAGLPGLNVLDLVRQLGIEDKMILVPKSSPSAKNRFIYYAGQVHRLPSTLFGFLRFALTNPILKGSLPSLLLEPFRRRPKNTSDETIQSFISRRFNPIMAENMLSAVVHGIYSGSIAKLSIRSTFRALWEYETKAGSVILGLLRGVDTARESDREIDKELQAQNASIMKKMKDVSVYSFQGGLRTLSDAMESSLRQNAKIHIIKQTATRIVLGEHCVANLNDGQKLTFDHLVSAVRADVLAGLIQQDISELKQIKYSTVMVINLFYSQSDILPITGFGYLIPISVPLEENPSRALGVVFDTSSVPGQDTSGGTKVTCIMGGHFWDGWTPEQLPTKEEAYAATKKVMSMHLGISEEPAAWNAKLQERCIPQYTVGHEARMSSLNTRLATDFPNLSLIGSSYAGVSVNDCVLNARKVVRRLTSVGTATGLEDFQEPSISGR